MARADADVLKLATRGCLNKMPFAICRMMHDCACVRENSAMSPPGRLSSTTTTPIAKPVDLPSLRPVSTAPMPA
jgi:hypothetical protein